jgi:predicted ATPase/class 3 adenylate cyclase
MDASESCWKCRAAVQRGSRFCAFCGEATGAGPGIGERRQLTIVFCDLVGSTALSQRLDPEDLRDLLRAYHAICRDAVVRHEGHISQFLGDGVLAYFGYPIAHEDDAVRAVHAALTILDTIALLNQGIAKGLQTEVHVRIGVDSGVTVIGESRSGDPQERMAFGEPVNLAAAIQAVAEADTVVVSPASAKLISGQFELNELRSQPLKGFARPVELFRVLKATGARSKFEAAARGRLTPHVGRDDELRTLELAWQQAREGQGRVVSLVGEAGLGKSRLLHEFRRAVGARPEGATVVYEGSCFAHGDASSYLPFRDLMRTMLGLGDIDSAQQAAERMASELSALGVEAAPIAPFVLNMLSYTVDDELFRALPAHVIRERTVAALRAVIVAVAQRQPIVLVIEDLHWIDAATEEVVNALVDAAQTAHMLLLLVFRPEYMHEWDKRAHHSWIALTRLPSPSGAELVRAVLRRPHAVLVPLRELSSDQSAEMVRRLLDAPLVPSALEQLVLDATEGNPLFIEELIASLIERGELIRHDQGWVLASRAAPKLPRTLQGVLLGRVDLLSDLQKEVLRLASVVGRVFSAAVIAGASGLGAAVQGVLGELERIALVYRMSDASPPIYSFKHVLCQQAVYDSLVRPSRERYHSRVGFAIESLYPNRAQEHCEILAFHFERSTEVDKAVEYLQMANRKSIVVSAMADAQDYFQRADKLLPLLPQDTRNKQRRLEFVLDQVFVALALFKYREYHELLEAHASIAETLGNRRLLGAFLARVGWCQWANGDFGAGIQTLNRAAEHCEAAGNDDDLGLALMTRAWCELGRGDFEPALSTCEAALRALESKFDLQSYVRTRAAATAVNAYLGRWNRAIAEGKKAVEAAQQYGDSGATSFAAMIAAWPYAFMGSLDQALELANLAVEKAVSPADRLFAQGSRALVECKLGQAAKAAEVLAEVVAVIRAMHFPACETYSLYYCEALWRAGQLEQAKVALGEVLEIVEACEMRLYVATVKRLLAEVALDEGGGQTKVALRYFEESIRTLAALGAENELALARVGYARALQRSGDADAARKQVSDALAVFERLGTLHESDRARSVLGSVASHPGA